LSDLRSRDRQGYFTLLRKITRVAAIEVSALTKDYGDLRANDELSFEVETGEVFGFSGPNGAVKTTTIRTLLGFMRPTAGSATILGADI
jgi:ABC-2 type transport system ATP-binding protein